VTGPTDAGEPLWALVTGASRGIGAATAVELARRGWDVVIGYLRNAEAAESVAGRVRQHGRRALLAPCNVAKREECTDLVHRVQAEVGALHGLVHCAGLGALSPTLETRPARWQIAWDTHVAALLHLLAEARPILAPGSGVVALSSIGARSVTPGYASIAATKGALETLVRYLAAELAPQRIHVNAVCGGPVDTDSLRSFDVFAQLEAESARRPCGRLGQPTDLAPVIAFLLGEDAQWIRGQVIVADGGFSLH
jgi:enoyl-[acyl-carrier protein] reductase III